jgi:hypothetical protein
MVSNPGTPSSSPVPRNELDSLLEATPSPFKNVTEALAWLESKSWILDGERYTSSKLADILHTVAVQSKIPTDVAAVIRAVGFIIHEIADSDISDDLANKITDKFAGIIDGLIGEITSTKNFLDATSKTQASVTLDIEKAAKCQAEASEKLLSASSKLQSSLDNPRNLPNSVWPALGATPPTPSGTAGTFNPSAMASQTRVQQRVALANRQLYIEVDSSDPQVPKDKSSIAQRKIRDRLNEAFITEAKARSPDFNVTHAIRGVSVLARSDFLIEFNNADTLALFTQYCEDHNLLLCICQSARIRPRTFPVILRFVPCDGSFDPNNRDHLRKVESENDLPQSSISSAAWCKRPELRSPNQFTANLKVRCASADAANQLLRDRIRVEGNLVSARKDLKMPIHCNKCQEYGHLRDECSGVEKCGTCASESHPTINCTNQANPRCVSCGDESHHASSSPSCPALLKKCEALDERYPENLMPYFPSEEQWAWVSNPPKPPHTSNSDHT